jgi:hypothetical protein
VLLNKRGAHCGFFLGMLHACSPLALLLRSFQSASILSESLCALQLVAPGSSCRVILLALGQHSSRLYLAHRPSHTVTSPCFQPEILISLHSRSAMRIMCSA